jgi:hypothetical protein
MDSNQFEELNKKLDNIDTALNGNQYDVNAEPGLIQIVKRHDLILFGSDGKSGVIGEIADTKDRKAKFDGMKLLVGTLAGAAVCVAAGIEVIDKCASWASTLFKK